MPNLFALTRYRVRGYFQHHQSSIEQALHISGGDLGLWRTDSAVRVRRQW